MRASLLVLLFALAAPAVGQPKKEPKSDAPRILYAVPLVVVPGQKAKLTLRGRKLDAVTEVKSADPKATARLVGKKATVPNNYPAERLGDTEVEVEVDLPADLTADAVELTAVGPGGPATYRLAVARGSVPEREPNDGFAKPQEVTRPAVIDGTIGREKDVDVFRFVGKAGEAVRVEVQAGARGSPADLFVVLYDVNRQIVHTADDTADDDPDPAFTVTLPRAGAYFVSVIDAHDLGGSQFGYRLRIGPAR